MYCIVLTVVPVFPAQAFWLLSSGVPASSSASSYLCPSFWFYKMSIFFILAHNLKLLCLKEPLFWRVVLKSSLVLVCPWGLR